MENEPLVTIDRDIIENVNANKCAYFWIGKNSKNVSENREVNF